ncbi:hypothetical protein [Dubosiella newyorkensis]|uniref:hypothetical protein n=1 Tax=Dubosiella newyorkensis TaxID=1862672 RepID=UPI003F67D382
MKKVYEAFYNVNAAIRIVDKQVVLWRMGIVETAFDATVQNANVKVFVTDCVFERVWRKDI